MYQSKDDQDVVRVTAGEKPPEVIERNGKMYKPALVNVTTQDDRKRGEDVYVISVLGAPLAEDE